MYQDIYGNLDKQGMRENAEPVGGSSSAWQAPAKAKLVRDTSPPQEKETDAEHVRPSFQFCTELYHDP